MTQEPDNRADYMAILHDRRTELEVMRGTHEIEIAHIDARIDEINGLLGSLAPRRRPGRPRGVRVVEVPAISDIVSDEPPPEAA